MTLFNKSNETSQKSPELTVEDRESVRVRWPIRHNAYAKLYATALSAYPEVFQLQPEQVVGSTAVSEFIVADTAQQQNPDMLRQAYERLASVQTPNREAA